MHPARIVLSAGATFMALVSGFVDDLRKHPSGELFLGRQFEAGMDFRGR